MVDRRSLVVGGGAAALAAVVGGLPPAAALAGQRLSGTGEHARRVLGAVETERGLVDLETAFSRLTECVKSYQNSPPRDPNADDLHAWTQQRVTELTGKKEPFAEYLLEVPQTRSLLGFAFVSFAQHKDTRLPVMAHSMPVPAVLVKLEPDFFPELVNQIEIEGRRDQKFADLIQAGMAELDRFIPPVDEPSTSLRREDRDHLIFAAAGSLLAGIVVYISETIKE
jgi:hypothetical protein